MEGPQQDFSTSNHQPKIAAANPEPSLTDSTENNENDSSLEKTIPMSQNTAPRRILVDRNENSSSSDGQSHNSNFVPKGSPKISSPSKYPSPVSLPYNSDYDDEVNDNTVADSYLKAYDPFTNYLSPRPRFLRFNQNRCEILNFQGKEGAEHLKAYDPFTTYLSPRPKFLRFNPNRCEILNFQGKEEAENLTGSCNDDKDEELEPKDIKDNSPSPGKESIGKQEIQENSENRIEKIEDEDEDEDEDEEEEEFEERGWCLRGFLKFMLILIAYSLSISYICSVNSPTSSTNQQVIWSLKNGYLIIQNCTVENSTKKLYDTGFMAVGAEDRSADTVEIDEGGILLIGEEVAKVEMVLKNAVIFKDSNEDYVTDEAAEIKDESEDINEFKFEKFEQSISAKAAENVDEDDCEMKKEVNDSNEDNFDEIDGASETEVVGIEAESKKEIFERVFGPGTHENEDSGGNELEKEEHAFNQSGDLDISAESDTKEFEDEKSSHIVNEVFDEIGYDEVEAEKNGWKTLTIIGVCLASIILGSLAFVFHSEKTRTRSTEESRSLQKLPECAVEETAITENEYCARSSLSLSTDESPEELSFQIHAPKVELIGELVVGDMSSSFRGGYIRKYQMIQSLENIQLIQPASASNQPSAPKIFSTNSSSHGNFTGGNKIINEGSKNAGEAKVKVTPVRRSSRIRNRASALVSMNLEN